MSTSTDKCQGSDKACIKECRYSAAMEGGRVGRPASRLCRAAGRAGAAGAFLDGQRDADRANRVKIEKIRRALGLASRHLRRAMPAHTPESCARGGRRRGNTIQARAANADLIVRSAACSRQQEGAKAPWAGKVGNEPRTYAQVEGHPTESEQ